MAPHLKETQAKHQPDPSEQPPPPYTPSAQYTASPPAAAASTAAAGTSRQQAIPRQFPPSFSMYNDSGWGQRHYMLGEHQATPLYAVSLHGGWSGQPDVVLHNGPSNERPPLAAAERDSWGGSATVTLPPLPGTGTQAKVEKMVPTGGFGHAVWAFSVETGPGMRRESFEWRHSSGAAVASLGGRSSGWKLVRLSTDAPSGIDGAGGSSGNFVGGGASSSDGKEVVAAWCWASGSVTKKLKFQFLGSGANGVLGERWAIAAVITALKIWDRERRQRNSNAGAGGAGAGA